ncbi:DDE superfamily endonuclease [Ceratobasidium sp. AG-Ba]|nr:DDE superfamily endonuclease [Ceratobasidium sp. AG-Ba]QRW06038.1 DDE superfamily endonuclease [Ceratobasidium sp. AG-Ba]
MFSIRRLTAMAACLRFYTNLELDWSFTRSSEIAALGAGYGVRFGKNIRRFVRVFINTDDLPENQYGTWNASILEDEDLATELKEYLVECKGRYMRAEDIVEHPQRPDVKRRFKLDEPPSIRTAQRWMKEFGFRWGEDPKGQYVDGHEGEDVAKYRNEHFIPIWTELERHMCWYDSKTMEYHVPALEPGERIEMFWFHDESIFYVNDRRLTRWVCRTETAVPYAKGEGASIMVADFVGVEGWLRGSDLEVVEERVGEDGKTVKIRSRYADTHFPDGSPQFLYFPDNHPTYPVYFKGIAELLRERGFQVTGLRLQCAAPKKCVPGSGCYARQLLSEQPGFAEQQSALEEIAEGRGCRILFLPKFHCELNPIEQRWGYAKRVYRQFARSKSQADLKSNMLTSLDSVPLDSIRRFFNKSQRYIDAYKHGLNGQMAAWVNKKYRGHRMLPPNALREIEAEFQRHRLSTTVASNPVPAASNST